MMRDIEISVIAVDICRCVGIYGDIVGLYEISGDMGYIGYMGHLGIYGRYVILGDMGDIR